MHVPFATEPLSGWGRYRTRLCPVYRPESMPELLSLLQTPPTGCLIGRGLGRSYGDAAVNGSGGVAAMTRLNRMISFDAGSGVLECEGGVSLAEILDAFVPRGFFLPVTPGTKFVTVAGAIAHDVHGKNHHCDGTFSRFVESFELWTPAQGILHCSPEEHADAFHATCGGAGLTGMILKVRLRLRPVRSAYLRVDYRRCPDLDTVLSAMADSDRDYQYSVAWVDCLAAGASLGRSVLMRGNHAPANDLPVDLPNVPFRLPRRSKLTVPFDFPGFVLNTWSVKAFNAVFYGRNRDLQGAVVDYDKYFYPLDGILHWNRMYGKAGFVQYQATFPPEGRAGLVRMLERLSEARRASFLAVLKCFGAAGPGLLSHPMPGYTLTLDVPHRAGLEDFVKELDQILLDHGGRLYLAKDTLAAPETVRAMYPRLDEFREIKRRLDPSDLFSSDLSRRLRLTGKEHGQP